MDNVTLDFHLFPDGHISYYINANVPSQKEELAKAGLKSSFHFTWSGSTNGSINAAKTVSGNTEVYLVLSRSQVMDGMVFHTVGQDDWILNITGKISYITDIYKGMTISEATTAIKKGTNLTEVKENGIYQGLKRYTVYTWGKNDNIITGQADFKKNVPFAQLFFNSLGKLEYWYQE